MYQTFSPNRSSSEGNAAPNMSRNNDDDDDDESDGNNNDPPLPSTSSKEPIYTTYTGNVIKHDNSVHKTNVSSFNAEDNEIINCFNNNYVVDPRQSLCFLFFFPPFLWP
jgi:hypothetical protein